MLNKYLSELKRQKTTHYSSTSTFYIMWDLSLCLYFLLLNSRLWVEEVTDYVKNIHWLDSQCPERVQFGRVLHGVKKGRKIGASIENDSRHAHLDVFSITCRNVRETHASLYVSSARCTLFPFSHQCYISLHCAKWNRHMRRRGLLLITRRRRKVTVSYTWSKLDF